MAPQQRGWEATSRIHHTTAGSSGFALGAGAILSSGDCAPQAAYHPERCGAVPAWARNSASGALRSSLRASSRPAPLPTQNDHWSDSDPTRKMCSPSLNLVIRRSGSLPARVGR